MSMQFSKVSGLISAILLIVVGMFAQQRYGVVGKYIPAPNQEELDNARTYSAFSELINADVPSERKDVDFQTFWEVWGLLERDYIEADEIDAQTMVDGAISGLASSLGDPYTIYLPPVDNERSAQDLAGAFYGVGIELGYVDGVLAAVSPLSGSPAESAGILPQDLIVHVADPDKDLDEDTNGWTLPEAVENIRGPKGSNVTLTVIREGATEPLEIDVTRDEIIVESVEVEMVEHAGKRVAHISLSRFGERTSEEWDKVVANILAEGSEIDGIVLDMRNNPGGFFDGAIDIASDFIEDGTVVSQVGKFSSKDYEAVGNARLKDIPTVILVNKGSASASEIVAGALRDDLGTKIIGTNTFGKGTVQDRRELSNGGGIHITVSKWLLPGGSWIHDEGIPVDVEVEQDFETETDEQLHKAIETL
ncbi:MAG: S41 family peptidase [Microgenomates group bacterium]